MMARHCIRESTLESSLSCCALGRRRSLWEESIKHVICSKLYCNEYICWSTWSLNEYTYFIFTTSIFSYELELESICLCILYCHRSRLPPSLNVCYVWSLSICWLLHSFVITFSHNGLLVIDNHTHPIQLQIDSHSIYLSWWCGPPAPVYPIDAPFTNNYNTSLLLIVTVYTRPSTTTMMRRLQADRVTSNEGSNDRTAATPPPQHYYIWKRDRW